MNDHLDREIHIVTPEHVQLRFQTAGVGSRAAAQIIDSLILLVLYGIVAIGIGLSMSRLSGWFISFKEYFIAAGIVLLFLINFGYFIVLEYFRGGQTIGKRALAIRVLQENGQSISFLSATIRNLFRLIDMLPATYFLGSLISFLHPRDKRIGDLVAGTIVVVEPGKERSRTRKKIHRESTRRTEPLPPITDHHRAQFQRQDWVLLSSFIERMPDLMPAKKKQFSDDISDYLVKKLDLHVPDTNHRDTTGLLLSIYNQLKEEWEMNLKAFS